MQVDVGPDRRAGAAFHVGDAAAMHLAVFDRAAPGIARPGFGCASRKNVDMAVEHEMAARPRTPKATDYVRQMVLG